MELNYHMIQTNIVTPWSIFTPCVFRMMEKKYVDLFFETGDLMLSSFSRFSQHEDEERKDDEGWNIIRVIAPNTMIWAVTGHGSDAYVLCGTSIKPDSEMLDRWKVDAAIQIFDTTAFAVEVARHIPGLTQGFEGYCYYSQGPIETKISDIQMEYFKNHPEDQHLDMNRLAGFGLNVAGQAVYFRKHLKYRHQMEYRWVWLTSQKAEDTLIIRVPRAREFCLPWYAD